MPQQDPAGEPINLQRGWPAPHLLPQQLVHDAAQHALSDPAIALQGLQYGPDDGYAPGREAIAAWLTASYRSRSTDLPPIIGRERITITGGASQSLGVLLAVYTDPGYTRHIWIVAPAYFHVFRIFDDAGFAGKLRAVPEDAEGIDLEYLRREIRASDARAQLAEGRDPTSKRCKSDRPDTKVYRHVLYCVPSFSNPSGRTMTLRRRQELVRLAREHDMLLAPDDVYDFLHWPADSAAAAATADGQTEPPVAVPLPRLVDLDRTLDGGAERPGADGFGNACSNGTFSKIVGPGLRIGWVEGSPKFAWGASQAGTSKSGGAPSHLTSTFLTHALRHGALQAHIRTTLLPAYARQYATLHAAITAHLLPLGYTLLPAAASASASHPPPPPAGVAPLDADAGGYFLWLTLPPTLRASAATLAAVCAREHALIVAPGGNFAVPGDRDEARGLAFARNLRLCFAWESEERLREGVRRLARATGEMVRREGGGGGEAEVGSS